MILALQLLLGLNLIASALLLWQAANHQALKAEILQINVDSYYEGEETS